MNNYIQLGEAVHAIGIDAPGCHYVNEWYRDLKSVNRFSASDRVVAYDLLPFSAVAWGGDLLM
jgi:hypothetical protein